MKVFSRAFLVQIDLTERKPERNTGSEWRWHHPRTQGTGSGQITPRGPLLQHQSCQLSDEGRAPQSGVQCRGASGPQAGEPNPPSMPEDAYDPGRSALRRSASSPASANEWGRLQFAAFGIVHRVGKVKLLLGAGHRHVRQTSLFFEISLPAFALRKHRSILSRPVDQGGGVDLGIVLHQQRELAIGERWYKYHGPLQPFCRMNGENRHACSLDWPVPGQIVITGAQLGGQILQCSAGVGETGRLIEK